MIAKRNLDFPGKEVWELYQGKHCLGYAHGVDNGIQVYVEGEDLGIAKDIIQAIEKGEQFLEEGPYFCNECGYNCTCENE